MDVSMRLCICEDALCHLPVLDWVRLRGNLGRPGLCSEWEPEGPCSVSSKRDIHAVGLLSNIAQHRLPETCLPLQPSSVGSAWARPSMRPYGCRRPAHSLPEGPSVPATCDTAGGMRRYPRVPCETSQLRAGQEPALSRNPPARIPTCSRTVWIHSGST